MDTALIKTGARGFFAIAEALCRAIGNAIRPGFIEAGLAMRVVRRIHRVRRALLALEALFAAGRVVRRTERSLRSGAELTAGGAEVRPCLPDASARLPRRFGWLCPLVPGEAACHGGQLRVLLAEPGMQDLLAACPQAVRLLAPVCRMLGIERAAYTPPGVLDGGPAIRARFDRVRVSRRRARLVNDPVVDDAHFAFSGVPRRFRLRVG